MSHNGHMFINFVRLACSALAQRRPFRSDSLKRSFVHTSSQTPSFVRVSAKGPIRERRRGAISWSETGTPAAVRFVSGTRRGDVVAGSGLEVTKTAALQLADVLHNVQEQLLPADSALTHTSAVLEGVGRHLGLDIEWNLTLGPNGAFTERFTADKFSCAWGTTPLPSSVCWETDYSGVSRSVELDDFESCLLTTWLRSGQWLLPSVLEELHIEIVDAVSQSQTMPDEVVMSSLTHPSIGPHELHGSLPPDDTFAPSPSTDATLDLAIRLKTGKVKVTLRVDRSTWLPTEIHQDLFGDKETWVLRNWQPWGNSRVLYPDEIVHKATSGGHHTYRTTTGQAFFRPMCSSSEADTFFDPPDFKILPPHTIFDSSLPSIIPAWKTPSCHVLVKPKINGQEIGYMILDTGASGLVMEKVAADALELEGFGELFVSGVSGKVPAHFRRAESLVLGPLTLLKPHFMEMPVPGLVAGACRPVVGIIGYDVFRRAVIELLPKADANSSSSGDPNFIVKLHDVEKGLKLPELAPSDWCDLHMITNLPHIKAKFSTDGNAVYEGLFMIDTGAGLHPNVLLRVCGKRDAIGGAFVMFMSRAVHEFNLQNDLKKNVKAFVKGVGGSQTDRLPVKNATLSWFELGGKKISCLFFDGSKMDISVYACGILCMNMLQDSRLVIDYARQRMAVLSAEAPLPSV